MSREEGYELASFSRYADTFFIGWIQLLVSLILKFLSTIRKEKIRGIVFSGMMLFLIFNMFSIIKTDGISALAAGNENRKKQMENDEKVAEQIFIANKKANFKTAVLIDTKDTYEKALFLEAVHYDLFPYARDITEEYCNDYSDKDFKKEIEKDNIQYLVAYQATNEFKNSFADMFNDGLQEAGTEFAPENAAIVYEMSENGKFVKVN